MEDNNGTDFGSTKDKAYEICKEFLGGAWQDISCLEMDFRPVTGGLSNALYLCSLPETRKLKSNEPSKVLLRIYVGLYTSVLTETVIFTMFSERKLGPKLYGVFPEGRLEEYIPALSLRSYQLRDPDISTAIARKMAKVHTLNAPVIKTPSWLFSITRTWLNNIYSKSLLNKLSKEKKIIADKALSPNWLQEIDWLESFLTSLKSPVVFCHNDLQEGNILLPEGSLKIDERMVFIDFEYCGYNYRGFDIGNHFTEWGYDYTLPTYPHYTILDQEYPNHEEQLRFVRSYLDALADLGQKEDPRNRLALEDKVLEEANAFMLASHLLWIIWAVMQGCTSKIKFGFLEYAVVRVDAYFRWKEQILKRVSVNNKLESDPKTTERKTDTS